jgi:catechol 2,3-dioxygenase-like lactoylglutathione lyase family enzyme
MITRVGSVPVFVSDQERALKFYRDQLGLQVVTDTQLGPTFRWITVTPGPGGTELILYRAVPEMNGDQTDEINARVGSWTGIVFLTDDIQSTYKTLSERGVEFEAEPSQQPWGGWETWFADPDGNRFHLAQR